MTLGRSCARALGWRGAGHAEDSAINRYTINRERPPGPDIPPDVDRKPEISDYTLHRERSWEPEIAAQERIKVLDMEVEQVTALGKSPQTVNARSLLCYWAHRMLGMTTVEIGKRLNISQSAVSRSSLRGQKIESENQFELVEPNA